MKRYILTFALMSLSTLGLFAQDGGREDLKGYIQDGVAKWSSDNDKFSFRVGARVIMDGAYYWDDYTDRSSGVRFSDVRIRLFSTLGSKFDFKFDLDFAPQRTTLKDIYLRFHPTKNSFLRLGNFAEPFSAENIQSSFDDRFIAKSATIEALGPGRALGLSYRHFLPNFWGEAGIFSQKYNTLGTSGDMGYGVSTRLLGRYICEDFTIHAGGGFLYRRPDANGFANGSDDFNRKVNVSSALETNVDQTKFLGKDINNVKKVYKYAAEVMASYRNVYLSAEYIYANHQRERDWESMHNAILGTVLGQMLPTQAAYKSVMGGDPDVNIKGVTVQAGILLRGGNYRYNYADALMERPGKGAIELVARYNYTDMNNIVAGSQFIDGGFYSDMSAMGISAYTLAALGMANGSWVGGKVNSFTVGLNYYFSKYIHAKLQYNYQRLDNRYNIPLSLDKNLHALHARVAFEF